MPTEGSVLEAVPRFTLETLGDGKQERVQLQVSLPGGWEYMAEMVVLLPLLQASRGSWCQQVEAVLPFLRAASLPSSYATINAS